MNRYAFTTSALTLSLAIAACGDNTGSSGPSSSSTASSSSSSSGNVAPQIFSACNSPPTFTDPNPQLVWTPNAIQLVAEELAPSVFAVYDSNKDNYAPKGIPLATSAGFIIGESGVVLVESLINRQLFCQLIALVQTQTDKPITHVINTSAHGDHCYGNTFLPSDVHIVQHKHAADYIAQHFAEDIAFMKMNFGADQGLDEIKPVAADLLVAPGQNWSIDLGGVQVEARDFGFAQTGGDLFVSAKSGGKTVLWTGNGLVAEQPAIPWLLDGHGAETGLTLANVKAAWPGDTIVVPGHGRAVGVDAFDFSVNYLSTLVSEVKTAVGSGKTEQETVTSVTMESFKGYALWDWIHTTVNVPAVYKESLP